MKPILTLAFLTALALPSCKQAKPEAHDEAAAAPTAAARPAAPEVSELAASATKYATGIPECDALIAKVQSCPRLAGDAQSALVGTVMGIKGQLDASPGMKASMGSVCADKLKQQAPALAAAGCPVAEGAP